MLVGVDHNKDASIGLLRIFMSFFDIDFECFGNCKLVESVVDRGAEVEVTITLCLNCFGVVKNFAEVRGLVVEVAVAGEVFEDIAGVVLTEEFRDARYRGRFAHIHITEDIENAMIVLERLSR